MIFTDLAGGNSVFLDANALVYHFTQDPHFGPACSQLLQGIEVQEIQGFPSTHVLSETAHRIMAIEAITTFSWPVAGIAQRLRQHPAQVKKLTGFRQAVERVLQSRIVVLNIQPILFAGAAEVSQQTGLLSNDALIVAGMQSHGLTHHSTHHTGFYLVPRLI